MTALVKYRTEELMQASLSHRCQFLLFKLLFCLLLTLFSKALCVYSSSLELHMNNSLALQHHAGQTALLQALTLGHMGSNDYSTTQIFVDNFLLSTLSIMSTNRFSPSTYDIQRGAAALCFHSQLLSQLCFSLL